ncbi:MAG: glycoside hydrolase family 3 protein [Deltaproteobacteria bacterium]|nr:glycoside hydrolase family 3 protein [Deltaproteobacteria bacterium]
MKNFKDISKFFIVGVKDFKFTPELESFLKEFPVAGLALFNSPHDAADNIWKDPESAGEIFHEFLTKVKSRVQFIAVDQEGGRVRRLRKPFIDLPSAQKITQTFTSSAKDLVVLEEFYSLVANQMTISGVNLNFAPVCDLHIDSTNKAVVGDRSFGSSETAALPYIQSFCRAFRSQKVATTLKHFPGHGPTSFDSHEKIATYFKTKQEVERDDKPIFLKLQSEADAIMTIHASFKEDPEGILSLDKDFLSKSKKEFSKNLAWISDDLLSMKAVSERKPWLTAYDCEYDFILICDTLEKSVQCLEETIRHSENKVKNFSDEENLEKRLKRSAGFFNSSTELAKFASWKKQILETSEKAHEILEKRQIS